MVSLVSGRLAGRPRDRRGLCRPVHKLDVGWADQHGPIEMMLSPSRHTDSPPASPMGGIEALLLLDLPTRSGAGFATVVMADRPPSRRRLAGRLRWAHLKLVHRVVTRGLAARDSPRQAETGDDRHGLAALADSVPCQGIGLRCCRGCRRAAGEAAPPAGVNAGTSAPWGGRRDRPVDHGPGGWVDRWWGLRRAPRHRDRGVGSIILPVREVPRSGEKWKSPPQ